jgi:hypothetical protein
MKKIILCLVVMILGSSQAYARSGACSGHGGVNCAAGSDYDGSVICSDGWRNSSVSYSSMVKCQGYSAPYVPPEAKVVVPIPPPPPSIPSCPSNATYVEYFDRCVCDSGYELSSRRCVKKVEKVKEVEIEEDADYLHIPKAPEKPKVISKAEPVIPIDTTEKSTDSTATEAVVGLGLLAGAGYLFKNRKTK